MPRQCISKRNKNIKEREKNIQSGNIFTFYIFDSMPRADNMSTLAHDRQKFDQ